MHVRDLDDNEYEIEDEARYAPEQDPVSAGLGARGFLTRHIVEECREEFPESKISRFPEMFDRFYWEPRRVLVDIVEDGSPEQLEQERARKRVDFKADWCAEHGWTYLPLRASDAQDAQRVRELVYQVSELLHGRGEPAQAPEPAPAASSPPARGRGKIQRPKATA